MKVFDYYDEKNNKDYVWYSSDNLYYSEAMDLGGIVNLKLVFKQGATYLYYKVSTQDYLMMKNNESNGTAFNTFIAKKVDGKPKYQYKRIDDTSLEEIDSLRTQLEEQAFKEQEEQISNVPKPQEENVQETTKDIQQTNALRNECLVRFDEDNYRAIVEINGKVISTTPCADKDRFMQLAFFVTPIISNLGGIVNFENKSC